MTDDAKGALVKIFLCSWVFLFAVSGCATPVAKITNTSSGKPETIINTHSVDTIKSMIISDMIDFGYQVDKDTPYLLELSRPIEGGAEQLYASLAVGNSYSENRRIATYTFVKTGKGIRVVASASIRAQMAFGQIKSGSLDDNGNIYNTFQKQLLWIKDDIENAAIENIPNPKATKKPGGDIKGLPTAPNYD